MKNVQAILKKELKVKEQLKAIAQEKEAIAINVLASTKEVLEQLGCEYLYEASVVSEKEIVEVTIKKGKVVQLPGKDRVQVVEDFTKIEEHLNTIAKNNKEIKTLKKTVSTYQQKENNYKTLIAELEAKLAQALTVKEEVKVPVVSEEDEYMLHMAANADKYISEETYYESLENESTNVVPEVKKEIKKEVKQNGAIKVEKLNIEMNSKKVAMYQTDKCHLIASPTTDEITWISKEILSDEYKLEVEKILISNFGFYNRRQKLSPIIIDTPNGYMARVSAPQGFSNFTDNDVLSGYVKLNNEVYLFTYKPCLQKVYVDSLAKKLAHEEACPVKYIKEQVTAQVFKLHAEYKAMLENNKKEKVVDKKQKEIVKQNNKNEEIRRNQRALDDAIVAATLGKDAVHSNTSPKPSARMSTSLEDIAF